MADPGFPIGGAPRHWGGAHLQCRCFLAKMYVKMEELDPVGGHVLVVSPGSANAFTPLILRIYLLFCIYLTLFNIIIPKIFKPYFTLHNFVPLLNFLFMHIQKFCWELKGTNLVIPCLCMHQNTKYFVMQ